MSVQSYYFFLNDQREREKVVTYLTRSSVLIGGTASSTPLTERDIKQ